MLKYGRAKIVGALPWKNATLIEVEFPAIKVKGSNVIKCKLERNTKVEIMIQQNAATLTPG